MDRSKNIDEIWWRPTYFYYFRIKEKREITREPLM
jgi:hypothetical protein